MILLYHGHDVELGGADRRQQKNAVYEMLII
jgi:hypothetical protein